jgi:hypothetical protein
MKFSALLLCLPLSVCLKAQTPVNLGTAANFGVLAGSTVTNTGTSVVNGDVGVSPGSAVTGFPPGIVNGTIHSNDATAIQAQNDLTTAYNDAAGRACTGVPNPLPGDIGGSTLTPGVYCTLPATSLGITGTVTLSGAGVYIFKIGSTLTTASSSHVTLINGATAANVFWQVGSSATLGTSSVFNGDILAQASITETTSAVTNGRVLARTGAVTLDTNTDSAPPGGGGPPPGTTPAPSSMILVAIGLVCMGLYLARKRLLKA